MQQLFREAGCRITLAFDLIGRCDIVAEKFRLALALFTPNEIWRIVVLLFAYHLLLLIISYFLMRGTISLRIRSLGAERDEYKRNWDNRDVAWKDREEELRRILSLEKDKEISQIKAEYDSYTDLLEQKLLRSRTRET
jgi:hypothetical protein